jgi:hypothetical protein
MESPIDSSARSHLYVLPLEQRVVEGKEADRVSLSGRSIDAYGEGDLNIPAARAAAPATRAVAARPTHCVPMVATPASAGAAKGSSTAVWIRRPIARPAIFCVLR